MRGWKRELLRFVVAMLLCGAYLLMVTLLPAPKWEPLSAEPLGFLALVLISMRQAERWIP